MARLNRVFTLLRAALLAAICFAAPALPAQDFAATNFAAPTGEVLLTLSGQISQTNGEAMLRLDAAQFAALPQHAFTTSTIWTKGTPTFKGVLLKDLVAAVGATGTTISLTALDDYQITIPMADLRDDGPLLAYLMDGKTLSLRDKGPVWLVYPFDAKADYRTEQTYSRSVWQLDRIAFKE